MIGGAISTLAQIEPSIHVAYSIAMTKNKNNISHLFCGNYSQAMHNSPKRYVR